MIEFIHKYPILIKALLTLVTVAFIGTGGWFLTKEDMGDWAAKVDDKKITMQKYQDAQYRMEDFYKQIYQGNMPPDLLKKMNIGKKALDGLVDNEIMLLEAKKQGIQVADDEISGQIKETKTFQDDSGNFSKKKYMDILKANGLTTQQYENSIREQLAVDRLKNAVRDSVLVNETELRDLYKKQNPGKEFDEAEFQKSKDNLYRSQTAMAREKALNAYMEGVRKAYKVTVNPTVAAQTTQAAS